MGSSLYLQGGAATQNTLKDTLTQVSHGFTVGSAIRYNAASSQWVTARANNAENAEVVGVVSEVQTTDTFTVVYSGVINIPALAGVSYPALFLSDTVPGGITHNPPSVIGSVVKPVVVRSVSNDGGYVVVNYLGTQIGGSSTVAIDQIQPVGTIMPFAGTAIPDTWLECNAQPVGVTVYPELYDKVLHSALPRAPIYGHRVNLVGTGLVTANFTVGDIVQFKSTSTAWSGGAYDSNATVLGKIISLTNSTNTTAASSMVVETLPIYNSTTKTFYHPNVVFGAGNGAATATAATTGYRILTTAGAYRSGNTNLVVSTTSIIDFLTPNLQGKFPLGTNDVADGDELTPSGSGFYNAASARTIGDIGGQEETLAGTQVATSTTTGLFATTVATGLREPNMPPFLTTKYIIKAKPYARAAIIDDVDVDYTRLLVTDLRSGIQRGAGVGEDLVFKTNTSLSTSGTERMRLSNGGRLGVGTSAPTRQLDVTFNSNNSSTTSLVSIDGIAIRNANQESASGNKAVLRFDTSNSGVPGQAYTSTIGLAAIHGASDNNDLWVWSEYWASGLAGTVSTPIMCFKGSEGRVGINTSSPTAKLQIDGADGTLPGLFVNQSGTDAATVSTTLAQLAVRSPAQIKCAGTSTLELLVGGLSGPVNNLPVGIQASNAAGTTPYDLSLAPFGGYVGVGLGLSAATSMLDVRTGVGKSQWARFLVPVSGGKTAAARIRGDSSYTGFLAQFDTDGITASSGYGLNISVGNLTQTTATSLSIDAATSATNATLVSTFNVYGDGRVYARGPVQSAAAITTSSPGTYLTTKDYVDSRDYTFTYGYSLVLARYTAIHVQGSYEAETGHFSANYFDVFPPSGKNMNNLVAFIPSLGRVYYDGGVNADDSIWCRYKIKTDRIRVWVFNTENRALSAGNWLAVWR